MIADKALCIYNAPMINDGSIQVIRQESFFVHILNYVFSLHQE